MMSTIITNPEKKDIPYMKKLWKDIFKDELSYIELFFKTKYRPENTFVLKENGEVVSMLFAELNTVRAKNKELRGAYLCGIATRADKRGRGFAKELIEHALSKLENTDIFYLIPANKELFDYYKKFGFKPLTFFDKEEIGKDKKGKIGEYTAEFSYSKLNSLYEKSVGGLYIKRTYEDFEAIYNCYKNFMTFEDGYIVYYISDGELNIIEYTLPYDKALQAGAYLMEKNSLDKGIILKRYGSTPFTAYKSNIDFDDTEEKYINLMLN